MVSPIQNSLTKNVETICRIILTKTSQTMIVNLLMMVWSIYQSSSSLVNVTSVAMFVVYDIWDFFLVLIEIISIAKLLIIVHFFVLQHEKQTLSYIHTKFEDDKYNRIFFSNLFCGSTCFSAPTLKIIWA